MKKVLAIGMALLCSMTIPDEIVSASEIVEIPYTRSEGSLTRSGKYLRLLLRNVWNADCEDVPQDVHCSEAIAVTFAISGLPEQADYTISLMGAVGSMTFWGNETDSVTAGSVNVTGDGTYTVQTILSDDADTIQCLVLDTDIDLYDFSEGGTVADSGIAITVQRLTTGAIQNTEQNLLGDPNDDGVVTVEDAVLVLSYYAKQAANLHPETEAEYQNISRGDVDGTGTITVEDAVAILAYYAQQSAGLPASW
jgi:hypothetical protein